MKYIKNNIYLFVLAGSVFLALVVVSPRGNFPLNDDWAYGTSVRHLLATGELKISEWVAPSTVAHVWWGFLWCKIFGFFSFTILRFSTLILSVSGALAFYLMLKEYGFRQELAFAGALALFFNPLWFVLSYSFMTDITYLSLCIISTYVYYAGIKNDKWPYYLAGSFFAAAAYLIRQTGIIIPFAVVLYMSLTGKINLRKLLLACGAVVIAAAAHWYWFKYVHGYTWRYINAEDFKISLKDLPARCAGTLFYLGLYTLPLNAAVYAARNSTGLRKNYPALISASAAGLAMIIFVWLKGAFPHMGNILTARGLGVISLTCGFLKPAGIFESALLWKIITLILGLSAVYFIYILTEQLFSEGRIYLKKTGLFLLVFLLQLIPALLKMSKFFDRHTIVLLPIGVLVSLEAYTRIRGGDESRIVMKDVAVYFLFLFIVGAYSCAGTMDYMNWSRAKWNIGGALVEKGYAPSEIDNGFEWTGWYTYENNMKELELYTPIQAIGEWDWYVLNNYKSMVSFKKPLKEEQEILRMGYKTPLNKKENFLYAWHR